MKHSSLSSETVESLKIKGSPTGIWGAVLLPIVRGRIDYHLLHEELQVLCSSNLHGIYTNGTAGEFHNQTDDEFYSITEHTAEIAHQLAMPFQIGISHSNPRVAIERLKKTTQLSPTGIQFTLPDWWVLSARERIRFACGLREHSVDSPLIVYNPPHAKQQLSLKDIAELRTHIPNLIGAKLPAGDDHWYKNMRLHLPDFSVFVPGHTLAFGRKRGASGSYSNVACLSPDGAVKHWEMMTNDPMRADELEERIQLFLEKHVIVLSTQRDLSNIALDKLLAAAGKWGPVSSELLWPYESATARDVERVSDLARQLLPELF